MREIKDAETLPPPGPGVDRTRYGPVSGRAGNTGLMRDDTLADVLVAPFCHSPMRLRLPHRSLFRRELSQPAFEALLRTAAPEVRQNVGRIFVATLLAERLGATLAFVEGWWCHVVERPRARPPRILTGARLSALLLRLLQRRRLVAGGIRPLRREASRCTVDEVEALLSLGGRSRPRRIVGVAGLACPSALRAHRYLAARTAEARRSEAHAPAEALARFGVGLDRAQLGLLRATKLGPWEALWYLAVEGVNWSVHAASELERLVLGTKRPLEQRLAHRFRSDHDAAPPARA